MINLFSHLLHDGFVNPNNERAALVLVISRIDGKNFNIRLKTFFSSGDI